MKNRRIKRKIGIEMQTKTEKGMKGIFGSFRYSKAWYERSEAIKARITKKINRIQVRKAERLLALKESKPVVYSIK